MTTTPTTSRVLDFSTYQPGDIIVIDRWAQMEIGPSLENEILSAAKRHGLGIRCQRDISDESLRIEFRRRRRLGRHGRALLEP